ncbi:hypothetical protein YYC_05849 [Plasmodium yoelii 17X]|uniref:Uncharacterized protein n=1 Tax=Plasmodium yoelii 17X TaxID=1323249 RepID=V7PAY3_PLAYE|nr:hypothetical protein YYC_05849 [Plasmodium yoelii 17X]
MDKDVCKKFQDVRNLLSDELSSSGSYNFKDGEPLNKYCDSKKCNSDYNKISAGCLYLLDAFFKDNSVFDSVAKSNINIVDYISIWLSYMLNLGKSEQEDNITVFYSEYIYNYDKYKMEINKLTDYDNYKKLLDKKNDVLNMDSKIVSKFYNAFKLLCEMYTEFDDDQKKCTKCSGKAEEFVKICKELNDSNNNEYSTYCQTLSTLSNDYNNLKNESKDDKPLPEINTKDNNIKCPEKNLKQTSEEISEQFSEDTSSSSIASKLIPVLLILSAIPIFLGIAYKYSLFGFRKRFQKQKLREKIKNARVVFLEPIFGLGLSITLHLIFYNLNTN